MSEILAAIIAERDRLNRVIDILQTSYGLGGTATTTKTSASSGSRRGHMSAAARKAASERMRKYWAGMRKKGAAKKA